MEANSLNTLFVGKNVGWKDSINLWKINNQNFVSIPYNMLLGLKKQNVTLDVVEEILRPENKRFMLNPVRICAEKYV